MTRIITIFVLLAFSFGSCFNSGNNSHEGKYHGTFTLDGAQLATGDMEFFSNPIDEDGLMLYVLPLSKVNNNEFTTLCTDLDLVKATLIDRIGESPYITENMKHVGTVDVTATFDDDEVTTLFLFHTEAAYVDSFPDWQINFVGTKVASTPDTTVAAK